MDAGADIIGFASVERWNQFNEVPPEFINNQTSVTIHVYGSPVRKGFIRYFNPHNNTAQRMYPPSVDKKILAIRTLGSVSESWSEDVLSNALKAAEPDYIQKECQYSLEKLRG